MAQVHIHSDARLPARSRGDEARRGLLAALPVKERRIELAGISTAVLEGGEGLPVVLLHGPMANATHWMPIIPGLAQTHRVVVPDLPHRIDSARVMEWLAALIEKTCAAPPYLAGHRIGGAIAARFAGAEDHRLRGLALVDSFGLAPGGQIGAGALVEQFGMPAIAADDLARIVVPTTVIWGRHDRATPLAVAEKACARYGWPLHVIEDCSDDPPVEQPEALLRALRAALDAA